MHVNHMAAYTGKRPIVGDVYGVLEDGGRLILEFRDYTAELEGVDRAIPVRLDEGAIMLAFLEYEPAHVNVHDVILLKDEDGWSVQKSAYRKLRIGTERVVESLENTGFRAVEAREERGFSLVVGRA